MALFASVRNIPFCFENSQVHEKVRYLGVLKFEGFCKISLIMRIFFSYTQAACHLNIDLLGSASYWLDFVTLFVVFPSHLVRHVSTSKLPTWKA